MKPDFVGEHVGDFQLSHPGSIDDAQPPRSDEKGRKVRRMISPVVLQGNHPHALAEPRRKGIEER